MVAGREVRVLTWNVNGAAVDRRVAQGHFFEASGADIVVLTETRDGPAVEDYLRALALAGLGHHASSFQVAGRKGEYTGRRRYGVLLAARWPIVSQSPVADAPWPERTVDVVLAVPSGPLRVIGAYMPLGSHGTIKSETFAAIGRSLGVEAGPVLVCGDFNAPRFEGVDEDGSPVLVTFGQSPRRSGGFGPPGHRQDRAERLLLDERSLGLFKAFRAIHGYGVRAASWSYPKGGMPFDYRLDHILVRGAVRPVTAAYVQETRHRRADCTRLSDHAALAVTLHMGE